jgi:hypothetical protein
MMNHPPLASRLRAFHATTLAMNDLDLSDEVWAKWLADQSVLMDETKALPLTTENLSVRAIAVHQMCFSDSWMDPAQDVNGIETNKLLTRQILETLTGEMRENVSDLERLIAERDVALRAYNEFDGDGGPLEAAYLAAVDELDNYQPRTPHEFVRLFAARYDNCLVPNDDAMPTLVACAARLGGMAVWS